MSNSNNKEDIKKFLLSLREQSGAYHNHKENMAWVAMVLYLGYSFWIMKFAISNGLTEELKFVFILITIFISYLAVSYIREQLENRRQATFIGDACSSLYFKILNGYEPKPFKLNPVKGKTIKREIFPAFLQDEIDQWKYAYDRCEYGSMRQFQSTQYYILFITTFLMVIVIIKS